MIWTKSLMTFVLVASVSQFGHSRALPTIAGSCNGEGCDKRALGDSPLGHVPADLLPRFDANQDHDFDGFTTVWSRADHQLLPRHEVRAVGPKLAPATPGKPKSGPGNEPSDPNTPSTDPAKNPFAPLDPTRPDSTPATPPQNPYAPLDPTKPTLKPSDNSSPVPSAGTASCGRKRADRLCPGPSDNTGENAPNQAPATVPDTRSNRPTDDNAVEYDYLAEVKREQGTSLVNDKLANLQSRIDDHVKDDQVRMNDINSKYTFDSKDPLKKSDQEEEEEKAEPFRFDNIFDATWGREQFDGLLKKAGVKLTDARGAREALRSNGAKKQTLQWSWSADEKVAFADWSYKKEDASDLSPKPQYTELTMALFKHQGVDPKKIEAIGRSRINNRSTEKTIDSIFKSLGMKFGITEVVLSRSDTDFAKKQAFDAYFRTANGKSTVNLLAYHAEAWGFRSPQTLVLQKSGPGSPNYNTLVTLG